MQAVINRAGRWAIPILALLGLLLFTPFGGIVNLLLGGGAVLGAGWLVLTAVLGLFDFKNYGYLPHWREIGFRIAGAVGLLLFGVVLHLVLPEPPRSLVKDRDCETFVGRSGPAAQCLD